MFSCFQINFSIINIHKLSSRKGVRSNKGHKKVDIKKTEKNKKNSHGFPSYASLNKNKVF